MVVTPFQEIELKYCEELPPAAVVVVSQRDADEEVFENLVDRLIKGIPSTNRFIAVDSEWFGKGQDRLDVLQISSFSLTLVIQIHGQYYLSDVIRELLLNPTILKVFKDPREDVKRLSARFNIEIDNGTVYDTTEVTKFLSSFSNHPDFGKDSFAKSFLSLSLTPKLKKNKKVTCSNWSVEHLSPAQISYAAFDTIFISTVYAAMTGCFPLSDEVGSRFMKWPERDIPMNDSLQSIQKRLASFFLSIYAVNPDNDLIECPSSIDFESCDLIGLCVSCKTHVPCTSVSDFADHQCLTRVSTHLSMCALCREIGEFNEVSHLNHKYCLCPGRSNTDSLVWSLSKQLPVSKSLSQITQFLKIGSSLVGDEDQELWTNHCMSEEQLSITFIQDFVSSLNEVNQSLLLAYVHANFPSLFNGTVTLISIAKLNTMDSNFEVTDLERRVLVFLLAINGILKKITSRSLLKSKKILSLYKQIFLYLIENEHPDWNHVELQLGDLIQQFEQLKGHNKTVQNSTEKKPMKQKPPKPVQKSVTEPLIAQPLGLLKVTQLQRNSLSFKQWLQGSPVHFAGVVVPNFKKGVYGGHTEAVKIRTLTQEQVELLLIGTNYQVCQPVISEIVSLSSVGNSRRNCLPRDIVIAELLNDGSCRIQQRIVSGPVIVKCKVIRTKSGIVFSPLMRGYPDIKPPRFWDTTDTFPCDVKIERWPTRSGCAFGEVV
ncbi:hypothetical protein RCL1_000829 [Eukaryota sp. TZLM3-RCL]